MLSNIGSRKLRKMESEAWFVGVCSGMAYFIGLPAWIVRLVWFCSIWFAGTGLGLYIILWIFVPAWESTPDDYDEVTGE